MEIIANLIALLVASALMAGVLISLRWGLQRPAARETYTPLVHSAPRHRA